MRTFSLIVLFILSFILQSTLYQYISIFEVIPNTNLILIVLVALFTNKKVGGVSGLLVGLAQDLLFGNAIGIHGLIYFLIGYLIGATNSNVSKENFIIPFIYTFIFTMISNIMFFFMYYFSDVDITFIGMIRNIALLESIYNSILSIFIYNFIKKLFVSPSLHFGRRD
ncbi:rod shape-determining protein MreD [Senegalia massiliensis]|uniref:rod shape-determining protein MreD n=1 Tax=Senegalia massiliensis TaxID=1720316 RepID=UPI00103209CB|nr:rod shape-determining protein MreD [Senegalia massiliensis]